MIMSNQQDTETPFVLGSDSVCITSLDIDNKIK